MYIEVEPEALTRSAVTADVLRRHMEIYFNYLDNDYDNLKKILGMEPLQIDILRVGTFAEYRRRYGAEIERVNPPHEELTALRKLQETEF